MNSKKYNNKLQIESAFRRGQELMKLNNYIQENLYFNKCQKTVGMLVKMKYMNQTVKVNDSQLYL